MELLAKRSSSESERLEPRLPQLVGCFLRVLISNVGVARVASPNLNSNMSLHGPVIAKGGNTRGKEI